jgi:hypothetical protein
MWGSFYLIQSNPGFPDRGTGIGPGRGSGLGTGVYRSGPGFTQGLPGVISIPGVLPEPGFPVMGRV